MSLTKMPVNIRHTTRAAKFLAYTALIILLTTHFGNWSKDTSVNKSKEVKCQPHLFVITPTYPRATQLAELTRLSQVGCSSCPQCTGLYRLVLCARRPHMQRMRWFHAHAGGRAVVHAIEMARNHNRLVYCFALHRILWILLIASIFATIHNHITFLNMFQVIAP